MDVKDGDFAAALGRLGGAKPAAPSVHAAPAVPVSEPSGGARAGAVLTMDREGGSFTMAAPSDVGSATDLAEATRIMLAEHELGPLHPQASRRFPPEAVKLSTRWVRPRPFWKRALVFVAAPLVLFVMTLVYMGLAEPARPDGVFKLLFALMLASPFLALFIYRRLSTHKIEASGYDACSLAEMPGFADDTLTLRVVPDDEDIEADEVQAREDGVPLPTGGLRALAAKDRWLPVGDVIFGDIKDADKSVIDGSEAELYNQLALQHFAREIELALGWPVGRVWITYLAIGEDEPGIVYGNVLIQGGAGVDTDQLCDAIIAARDAVNARYAPAPF